MREDKVNKAHDQLRQLLKRLELNETYYKILEVACRSYDLHVTQADTIKIIREHFDEKGENHRIWWITDIVKKGRKLGEDNWRATLDRLCANIPTHSREQEPDDSQSGITEEEASTTTEDETEIKLLKTYFAFLDVDNTSSFIGKASCKAFNQGLSVDQTVRAIEEYFYEHDLFHRHDWIKKMVVGARNFAKRTEIEEGQW